MSGPDVRRFALNLADGTGVGTTGVGTTGVGTTGVVTSVRPSRVRNRNKAEPDEKVKKPANDPGKKSPPTRKAPARGRYVDEYARPTF